MVDSEQLSAFHGKLQFLKSQRALGLGLKVQVLEFRSLGFRIQLLEFKSLGFSVSGSGLEFRV